MGNIRLLTDEVASQVAAGEVVERPASVIKELVENSLDAGARRVTVEFVRGGVAKMRVTDDAAGMDRQDALLSLERHATSKIRNADDLARVGTMGFRGEAIPSIASVSRFRMITRPHDDSSATEIRVAGGKVESIADAGAPHGTLIEVEGLFYNVPARRKFLRGEETESAHIVHQMQVLALAHPHVAFTLLRDGRRLWQTAATSDLGVRIRDLLGADFFGRLAPLESFVEHGIELSGFLSKPGEGRPNREQQYFILNGRVIQCPAISQPLREAYAEALPRGKQPLAVLRLAMDPLAFDCNVHPAKREIRLHRPEQLRQAVFLAARRFLEHLAHPKQERPAIASVSSTPVRHVPEPAFVPPPQRELPATLVEARPSGADAFRLVGCLDARWVIMEGKEGLLLMDVRAASERILFEALRREAAEGSVSAQRLLLPVVVELSTKDCAWIMGHLSALTAAGFLMEPFGGNTFRLEALPACLAERDPRDAILSLCESLKATGAAMPHEPALEQMVRSIARLAALQRFSYDESRARRLVNELFRCELPYACPQGRPTIIQWAFGELERKFGRTQ